MLIIKWELLFRLCNCVYINSIRQDYLKLYNCVLDLIKILETIELCEIRILHIILQMIIDKFEKMILNKCNETLKM